VSTATREPCYSAILFDVDGTLVDSNDAHAQAWVRGFAEAGISVDPRMDGATSSDDAGESKPDPDIIEAALKRAHASASAALMVGDNPYHIVAAKRRKAGSSGRAKIRCSPLDGGCSSGVERLTVAQEVAGSRPVIRPNHLPGDAGHPTSD
jgi:hypothetical protein